MIESGMTFDYGQIVMDNEFAKMIKFAVNGIPVNDATLSVDQIKAVGPFQDHLSHPDTFDNMRLYPHPDVMDRRMRDSWEADGQMDLYARAMETARKILATHEPDPLAPGTRAELREIVIDAENELGLAPK